MNWTIFKNTWKQNWKLVLIFLGVLCLYLGVIIGICDPNDMAEVAALYGSIESFLGPFGIDISAYTSPLNYTASTFFSILVMAFTMVFYVIQATALIAKPVDDTSIVCTLAAPVKRSELVLTRGVYLICAMAVLFLGILATGGGVLASYGEFDFAAYCELVAFSYVLCTAVAMLSYFLSVAFCDSKLGVTTAVAVPMGLMVLAMVGSAGGEKLEWMKEITPFGWLDGVGIVTGEVETLGTGLGLAAAILVLLGASVWIFNKKRLPV